jgi:hypothetical protein
MFRDMFGNNRVKLGLHLHTTLSDGIKTPDEVAAIYKAAGYDAIAITDHWVYGDEQNINGLKILSGCEYNQGGRDAAGFVSHIVGYGMKYNPLISPDIIVTPQEVVNMINAAGGLATLAHPAWSLNTPEQIASLDGIYATEIYNAVSDVHESCRPDSSVIADLTALRGKYLNLTATDDAHYYEADACSAWVMAKCDTLSTDDILNSLSHGDFYSTRGPEIHISRENNFIKVHCSPASRISFLSNTVWARGRNYSGSGMTYAETELTEDDRFIRAEVTDSKGLKAWSNYIIINN